MKRSLSIAACTLLAATWLSASPAGAAPRAFALALVAPTGVISGTASVSTGLTVGRIFDSSGRGDIVSFASGDFGVTPVGGSVFGFSLAPPLNARISVTTNAFSASASSGPSADAMLLAAYGRQAVGMRFDLLGGTEATASLQSSSASFGTGPFAATSGPGPAVFAFYNFPQARSGFGLGQAFGLHQQDGALAATLTAPQQVQNATATSLSSPLISSLSAQGPFWYSAYTPALRGSSLTLTIPFKLARIPVKLRLGEQAATTVASSSLATQILGPTFASSAGGKYNAVSGSVTLALPLLSRRATVSLDGWYETLQQYDKTPFNLAPYASRSTLTTGGSAPGAVIYTPSSSDFAQYVGAASVAVPVTPRLTVNGSFSEQLSGSVDLSTLTQSLTQHKTAYGGGVAYNFPKTNSSIDLFFNRNVYTDDNAPAYQFTENRQNLYFSVKFKR